MTEHLLSVVLPSVLDVGRTVTQCVCNGDIIHQHLKITGINETFKKN